MRYITGRGTAAIMGLAGMVGVAGCSDTGLAGPGPVEEQVVTVDADARWAFVRLGEPATEVTVSDRTTSLTWDIAFNATRVMLNGGAAGPGDVRGYCLCQNAGATDAQVQVMTPENQRAAFDAVSAASIPTDADAWETDVLDPAIADWYAYDLATHTVTADPTRTWQVRGAGASPEYAKLRVIDIADGTRTGARVTIEFAVQPSAGAAFDTVQRVVLDGRTAPVYFDFATASESDASNWDIVLDGFQIRINGGVSGSGNAGAVLAQETFDALTDASSAPPQVYRGDAYGGAFAAHPWYRYNLDGFHTIFPTFDVYLIDTGERVYKLQVVGYYDIGGNDRQVSFRYEPLN